MGADLEEGDSFFVSSEHRGFGGGVGALSRNARSNRGGSQLNGEDAILALCKRHWSLALVVLQSLVILILLLSPPSSGSGNTPAAYQERFHSDFKFVTSQAAEARSLRHLIIVPGHAISMCCTSNLFSDAAWWLLDYQRGHNTPSAIMQHIEAGVKIASSDPFALLVFSGGATREPVGPRTEGSSYFYVADGLGWWGHGAVRRRAVLEEYARDSFENLLFSIARFREVSGSYPKEITVVGFDFKAARFEDLHRKAIGFPAGEFHYHGIHPDGNFDTIAAERGEEETRDAFSIDPYGCRSDGMLGKKRHSRDPFLRTPPYTDTAPEIRALLTWCEDHFYSGPLLPWG
jgi:hypothetical protein